MYSTWRTRVFLLTLKQFSVRENVQDVCFVTICTLQLAVPVCNHTHMKVVTYLKDSFYWFLHQNYAGENKSHGLIWNRGTSLMKHTQQVSELRMDEEEMRKKNKQTLKAQISGTADNMISRKSGSAMSGPAGPSTTALLHWAHITHHVLLKIEQTSLNYLHFPPALMLWITLNVTNYQCSEQIRTVQKMFELLKSDCVKRTRLTLRKSYSQFSPYCMSMLLIFNFIISYSFPTIVQVQLRLLSYMPSPSRSTDLNWCTRGHLYTTPHCMV